MSELVSVIVPVYNADRYLEKCIETILSQTYRDIELILIDDGSIDRSNEICDRFAKEYPQVRVFHKANEGLVQARKDGVKNSIGNYIMFVDADDFIECSMVEELMDYLLENDCQLVSSAIIRQIGDKYTVNGNYVGDGVYDKGQLADKVYPIMLSMKDFFCMGVRPNLVGKIFRKDKLISIQNNAPNNVINGEDVMITYPYLLSCERVYFTSKAWYHYIQHPQSMSQSETTISERISNKALYFFLKKEFDKYTYGDLNGQLSCFMTHLLIQRDIGIYDDDCNLLKTFGGVLPSSKIVVYGAGKFGKQVYYYLCNKVEKIIWVDRCFDQYQEQGLPVCDVNDILDREFDEIVIAIIDCKIACEVASELIHRGVFENKIRTLDVKYLTDSATVQRIINSL